MEKLQANFIRIGNKIINLSQIVDVFCDTEVVRITTTETTTTDEGYTTNYVHRFGEHEAAQVKKFFDCISFDVACFDDKPAPDFSREIKRTQRDNTRPRFDGLYTANGVL